MRLASLHSALRGQLLTDNQIRVSEGASHSAGLFRSLVEIASTEPKQEGILTGLTYLDRLTSGLRPGKLNLVAAYTSHGKTALMLTTGVANMAEDSPWLFFTADDSDDIVLGKIMAMLYGMPVEEVDAKGPRWRAQQATELEGQVLVCAPQRSSSYSIEEMLWVYEEVTEFWGRPPAFCCFDYLSLLSLSDTADERQNVVKKARNLKALARRTGDSVWLVGHQCKKEAGSDCNALTLNHLEYGGHQESDGVVIGCRRRIDTTKMPDWELELEAESPTTNISVLKNKITGRRSPNPIGLPHVIDPVSGILREMTDPEKRLRETKGKAQAGTLNVVQFRPPSLASRYTNGSQDGN
jgi:KaiC/GvpD/RAD55 family RecA-like ATPase